MKKRRFLASIVLIVSTLALITSCQQNEENVSSGKSSLRYLSVADGYLDYVYHSVEIVFVDPKTECIMYKDNQTHKQTAIKVSDLKGVFGVSVPTGDNFVSRYNML